MRDAMPAAPPRTPPLATAGVAQIAWHLLVHHACMHASGSRCLMGVHHGQTRRLAPTLPASPFFFWPLLSLHAPRASARPASAPLPSPDRRLRDRGEHTWGGDVWREQRGPQRQV